MFLNLQEGVLLATMPNYCKLGTDRSLSGTQRRVTKQPPKMKMMEREKPQCQKSYVLLY